MVASGAWNASQKQELSKVKAARKVRPVRKLIIRKDVVITASIISKKKKKKAFQKVPNLPLPHRLHVFLSRKAQEKT